MVEVERLVLVRPVNEAGKYVNVFRPSFESWNKQGLAMSVMEQGKKL